MELPFPPHSALLPGSEGYSNLRMVPGGADALEGLPGWASFVKLWPRSDAILAATAGDDDGFNLSDVDLVVDGEPDCYSRVAQHSGCIWYERDPALGITGAWGRATRPSGTRYYEVKAEPGRERERIEAVKAAFAQLNPDLKPGVNWPKEVFTPVKYSYLELWRWAVLLDRFAQSGSNDIGVKRAQVWYNLSSEPYESHYLPAAGLAPVEGTHRLENRSRIRPTIEIWSFNPQKTIRALPRLLSQLGIPADAVGVVVDGNELPTGPVVPH